MGDSRSTVSLLGAGASMDAGLPSAWRLLDRLEEMLATEYGKKSTELAMFRALRQSLNDYNEGTTADAEHVYAAMQALVNWADNDLAALLPAPQVGSWTAEEVRAALFPLTERIPHLVEVAVSENQVSDVGYLSNLLRLRGPDGPAAIATLNYDPTIEMAAEKGQLTFDRGPWGLPSGFRWRWSADSRTDIRLLKLHGSVGWAHFYDQSPYVNRILFRQAPFSPGGRWVGNGLIFGAGWKLRTQGPYLAMFSELERWLEVADRVLIIGYSFRDEHVNDVLTWSALNRPDCQITVVDPNWPDEGMPLPVGDFRDAVRRADGYRDGRIQFARESAKQFISALES